MVSMVAGVVRVECPTCGARVTRDDVLTCSRCNRDGCCTQSGGCMPNGPGEFCPECQRAVDDENDGRGAASLTAPRFFTRDASGKFYPDDVLSGDDGEPLDDDDDDADTTDDWEDDDGDATDTWEHGGEGDECDE